VAAATTSSAPKTTASAKGFDLKRATELF
jgi:DCN1-like protein 1/2